MRPDKFKVRPFPDLRSFGAGSEQEGVLRVCILTEEIYGPVRNGGIASTYYHLARMLVDQGHQVTILYMKSGRSEKGPIEQWVEYYASIGITFVPLPLVEGQGISHWQRRHYSAYVWLKNQSVPFDVVHASEWRGGAYYSLLAKRQGLAFQNTLFLIKASSPHIWNRHYMMEFLDQLDLSSIMYPEQMSIELADMVIGGSAHLLRFMEHMGYTLPENRTYVQPNVLQFDALEIIDQRGRVDLRDRIKTKELVFFGRLEARKGLEVFCDALDFLVARGVAPGRVAFMGKEAARLPSSPHMSNKVYIETRAKDWPFEIEIHDTFDQPQALSFLIEKPRIAVMPSLVENSSMAVYEALMYKIPFIASSVGGTPELVREEDREHVLTPANPRSLANAMERTLTDGGLVARCSFDNDENLEVWRTFHRHLARRKAEGTLRELFAPAGTAPEPRISLCVHSDGDVESLETFVDSALFAGGVDLHEIVVATTKPNREIERIASEAQGVKVSIVDAHELSLGEAWNAAAKAASGEAYMFLRSDIHTPLPGYASAYKKAFCTSGADALTSVWRHRESENKDGKTMLPIGNDLAMAILDKDTLSGRGIAVKSDVFWAMDGFDPVFGMGGIEQELLVRIAHDGKVQIVPEPLYVETESRTRLALNDYNAQYMTNSSLIDSSPYHMKRLYLAVGHLMRERVAASRQRGDAALASAIEKVKFVNQAPLPRTGYAAEPRLRLRLDESSGRVELLMRDRAAPVALKVEVNNKYLTDIPLVPRLDGQLYGIWDLRVAGMRTESQPLKVSFSVRGESDGPRRLVELMSATDDNVVVASPENFIESARMLGSAPSGLFSLIYRGARASAKLRRGVGMIIERPSRIVLLARKFRRSPAGSGMRR